MVFWKSLIITERWELETEKRDDRMIKTENTNVSMVTLIVGKWYIHGASCKSL